MVQWHLWVFHIVTVWVTHLENVHFIFCMLKWLWTREGADPTGPSQILHNSCMVWALSVQKCLPLPEHSQTLALVEGTPTGRKKNWTLDVLTSNTTCYFLLEMDRVERAFEGSGMRWRPTVQKPACVPTTNVYVYMFVTNALSDHKHLLEPHSFSVFVITWTTIINHNNVHNHAPAVVMQERKMLVLHRSWLCLSLFIY